MPFLLLAIFAAGFCCLKWYWSDLDRQHLERQNKTLLKANRRLIETNKQMAAMRPERNAPDAHRWGDEVYERLAKDVDIPMPTAKQPLHLVDPDQAPREAHSHQTKGESA